MNKSFAIEAKAFYSKSFDEVKFINKGIFLVNDHGFIEDLYKKSHSDYKNIEKTYWKRVNLGFWLMINTYCQVL